MTFIFTWESPTDKERQTTNSWEKYEALEIILDFILLNFQGLCIRKYYRRAPQLATKESEGATTKTLKVIYKLNNACSQILPTILMKKEAE